MRVHEILQTATEAFTPPHIPALPVHPVPHIPGGWEGIMVPLSHQVNQVPHLWFEEESPVTKCSPARGDCVPGVFFGASNHFSNHDREAYC